MIGVESTIVQAVAGQSLTIESHNGTAPVMNGSASISLNGGTGGRDTIKLLCIGGGSLTPRWIATSKFVGGA